MVNRVQLIGRLGKNPETKSLPSGTAVSKFSLATEEKFTDRNGEKQDRTEWHNVVAWGKLADICEQYLTKGKLIYVEGSLRTESWDDKHTGKRGHRTDIVASSIRFLDKAPSAPVPIEAPAEEEVPF